VRPHPVLPICEEPQPCLNPLHGSVLTPHGEVAEASGPSLEGSEPSLNPVPHAECYMPPPQAKPVQRVGVLRASIHQEQRPDAQSSIKLPMGD